MTSTCSSICDLDNLLVRNGGQNTVIQIAKDPPFLTGSMGSAEVYNQLQLWDWRRARTALCLCLPRTAALLLFIATSHNYVTLTSMMMCGNPPACRRVWLWGVVLVSVLVLYLFLFLACTCSFVLFPRVFASSESKSPPFSPPLPPPYYYYCYYCYYCYYYYCYPLLLPLLLPLLRLLRRLLRLRLVRSLRTQAFAHRSFCTQKPLHTEAFPASAQKALPQQSEGFLVIFFPPRSFYTQKLLHT